MLEKLQENQQRHEEKIFKKQVELEEQKNRKQQEIEEYRIYEKRQLHEDAMLKKEINSIQNKIFTLASNTIDITNISRLAKLLLHHHEDQNEYIYISIIALGNPYDTIIKNLISDRITNTINKNYPNSDYSFQRKCVKYFMPNFEGYEFDVFMEKLMSRWEFENSIQEEIQELEFKSKEFTEKANQEIEEKKENISKIGKAIRKDIYANKKLKSNISAVKFLFGEEMSIIPRINILSVALYVGSIYFLQINFDAIIFSILMAIGYLVSYACIEASKKKEQTYKYIEELIDENNVKLEHLIYTKEKIEKKFNQKKEINSELSTSLISYSLKIQQ